MVDLGPIFIKLIAQNKAKKIDDRYLGDFTKEELYRFLTTEEADYFLDFVHWGAKGDHDCEKDIHMWEIDLTGLI
jgi:hypothetical protein